MQFIKWNIQIYGNNIVYNLKNKSIWYKTPKKNMWKNSKNIENNKK